MSITQRDTFMRWLPTLVAVSGFGIQLATFAAWTGRLDQRLVVAEAHVNSAVFHMPLDQKFALFVPRSEYAAKVASRDQEFVDLRRAIENLSTKIDRLIERRNGGEE